MVSVVAMAERTALFFPPPDLREQKYNLILLMQLPLCKAHTEMEFMDINLTKDSSLLLYAIHSLAFYWRILKSTIVYSGFKNSYKEILETRKLEYIHG
jgi:hypothetical protein